MFLKLFSNLSSKLFQSISKSSNYRNIKFQTQFFQKILIRFGENQFEFKFSISFKGKNQIKKEDNHWKEQEIFKTKTINIGSTKTTFSFIFNLRTLFAQVLLSFFTLESKQITTENSSNIAQSSSSWSSESGCFVKRWVALKAFV